MSRQRLNLQVTLGVWNSADVPAKDINLRTVSVGVVLKANKTDEIHQGLRETTGDDGVFGVSCFGH